MKHIIYHGLYKSRADAEMDVQLALPKRATVEFAYKEAKRKVAAQRYTETAIIIYTLDERIYSINAQRVITGGVAGEWDVKLIANIEPARQLAKMPDYTAAHADDGKDVLFLRVIRQLYERLAAIVTYWDEDEEPKDLPVVSLRLGGMRAAPSVN